MIGPAARLGRALRRWGWGGLVAASLGVLELDNATLGLRLGLTTERVKG